MVGFGGLGYGGWLVIALFCVTVLDILLYVDFGMAVAC